MCRLDLNLTCKFGGTLTAEPPRGSWRLDTPSNAEEEPNTVAMDTVALLDVLRTAGIGAVRAERKAPRLPQRPAAPPLGHPRGPDRPEAPEAPTGELFPELAGVAGPGGAGAVG